MEVNYWPIEFVCAVSNKLLFAMCNLASSSIYVYVVFILDDILCFAANERTGLLSDARRLD